MNKLKTFCILLVFTTLIIITQTHLKTYKGTTPIHFVSFYTQNAFEEARINVGHKQVIPRQKIPSDASGIPFHWYTDKECTQEWNPSNAVTSDIALYRPLQLNAALENELEASVKSWSVCNLIITLAAIFVSVVLTVSLIIYCGHNETAISMKCRIIGIIIAPALMLIFIMTQNMSEPMSIADKNTPLMAVIACVQMGSLFVINKQKKLIRNESE